MNELDEEMKRAIASDDIRDERKSPEGIPEDKRGTVFMENTEFEGWAAVELFGHVREVGLVTAIYFGNQCFFRILTDGLPECDVTLLEGMYHGEYLPAGSVVRKKEIPRKERLVGAGAVYAINPCTQVEVEMEISERGEILAVVSKAE